MAIQRKLSKPSSTVVPKPDSKKKYHEESKVKKGHKKLEDKSKAKYKSDKKKGVKERGRTKEKKRVSTSSTSSSSSSSGSRSSSSSSSSTGSSSSSSSKASSKQSHSGTARSSSSSSSSSSSTSASSPKKKDAKEKQKKQKRPQSTSEASQGRRKKRSPTPRPKKIHVGHLSRSIKKDHLQEIFGLFGKVKLVELPMDRVLGTCRGFGYVEFEKEEDADYAIEHMDGGQIDGQVITVGPILMNKPRMAPMRWGGFQPWRRNNPFPRRDWDRDRGDYRRPMSPIRHRSPIRRRSRSRSESRSPNRKRRGRRSSSSSH